MRRFNRCRFQGRFSLICETIMVKIQMGRRLGRTARKGGAMSRKKAKMLFWAALVVLAYIPYLMQSASHAIM